MLKQKSTNLRLRHRLLSLLAVLLVFVCSMVAVLYTQRSEDTHAAAGINESINFQGRLLTDTGAVVPDGTYNIEFKIYCGGDGGLGSVTNGSCAHATEEDLLWTETRESGNKVVVKNGYFSVYLGSVTAFGSNIDWNQDELYLSINIGGTGSPSYDGEMDPFTRLGATPYALNSKYLNGLSGSNFVQLAQGVQTDGSTTNASIGINKTGGTADILNLQKSSSSVVVINNTGQFDFTQHGAIGANATVNDISLGYNAAESQNMVLVVEEELTTINTDNASGIGVNMVLNPGGAVTTDVTGVGGGVEVKSGNSQNFSGNLVGAASAITHSGSGTLSEASGGLGLLQGLGSGTVTSGAGLRALVMQNGASSIFTEARGLRSQVINLAGTIGTAYGLQVEGTVNAGTLTTNYGISVAAQTGGASDYGVAIGAADTQTLWLSSNADNTTAAAGIAFGSSRDTNLYRSAANTLKTDDSLEVTGSADIAGHMAVGDGGTVNTNAALLVNETYSGSDDCTFGCYGISGVSVINNAASNNLGVGVVGGVQTAATAFTLSRGAALFAANSVQGAGSTITEAHGLYISDQTGSASDYGITIEGADTQALWIGSGADNTDAANGLAFGASRDTNLYRSAANTLKTDDSVIIVGTLSVPMSGTNSEGFGAGVTSSGTGSTAVGNGATATGANGGTAIGRSANAGSESTAIGNAAVASTGSSVAIGRGSTTTAAGQLVIGSAGTPMTTAYFGNGVTSTAPGGFAINASGGSGTDIAGADLTLAGGRGTGAGIGGAINLQTTAAGGSATTLRTLATVATFAGGTGAATFQTTAGMAAAFNVNDSGGSLLSVDTSARSGSGGNLIKIGNSTGTDTATTVLQLDHSSAALTTNLSALNGGMYYDSNGHKFKIIENGVVKTLCNETDAGCGAGGSGARLDQITAASTGSSINNSGNNVVWNWQLANAETGFTFTENTASTGGGTNDQFVLGISTLSGSTASPLNVTSNSVDAADIVFNLASAGDLVVQDNGTAVLTVSDSGAIDTAYSSTSTSAATEKSLTVTVADTGVVTTGTDSTYGQQISVTRTGATGGTINTYGLDVTAVGDSAGAGTSTVYGVRSIAQGTTTTADNLYGFHGGALAVLSGSVTKMVGVSAAAGSFLFGGTVADAYALQAELPMAGGGTISNGVGLQVQTASVGGGASIASNYGIRVAAQTAGTADYGIAVEAADTQTLWLSSNANNTTASAGIAFGSSRDTTLYRSDVATLKTDGNFQVGSATSPGNIDIYGDVIKRGITQQTGLTGITDVFVYDTTKDSDGGAWTNSQTSQGLSWYTESKDDGFGDACNIASDDRCDGSAFPKKAVIVSTASAVYIFDMNDYKMFMKFSQNGSAYAIGADTNNDPSSVFALNGVVYVGANGSSAGGLYALDFTQDRLYNYNTTDRDQGNKNIANRNTAVTYATDSRTAMAIRHNAVNAVHGTVLFGSSSIETNGGPLNGATFIAAATDDSMSVINLSAQQTLDYGDQLTDQFSAVYVTRRGRLYGLNVTLAQVERYGTQATGAVGIDVAKADQQTPTDVFDEQSSNVPHVANGASAPTFTVGNPDALKVLERASMADDAADLLYVGHSGGLTELHDVNSPTNTSIGWSKNYNISRETAYMSGNPRGMFSFDNASGDLTDATIRNSILEAKGSPTYNVNGVHGTALRFDNVDDYLCSDANNDATCDTDTDFNVAAISSHIDVWFRHSTTAPASGTDVLVDKRHTAFGAAEGIGYTIEMNTTGNMIYGIQDTAATAGYDFSVTSTQAYNDNQWHHLVAVNTDAALCLYIDGKLAVACSASIAATTTLDASQILTVGADASGASGANFWDGDIDDLFFSGNGATTSDTLTQTQIRKKYLEGRGALAHPTTKVTDATATSSTTIGDSGETYVQNAFVGSIVEITGGTGAGQTRRVVANDGTTLTVSPAWTVTPSTDSDYEVVPEQLYGSTNSVTSIGINNAVSIGNAPSLYIGTSDGSDGGGVSVFTGYANAFVSQVYHSDAGVTASSGSAWTGADADDMEALAVENGVIAIGSGANIWLEKEDRNLEQDIDAILNQLSNVRAELIVDGMIGTSTEGGTMGGADLAERYTSVDALEPGDIVSMEEGIVGAVVKSTGPYDKKLLGIVATAPGLVIGPQDENSYPIALSGRVPVKVMVQPGQKIKSGDRITSSSLAGYGMKATQAGRVLGTALEDVNESMLIDCPAAAPTGAKCTTITVFVNLVDFGGESIEVALQDFKDGGLELPETVLEPVRTLFDFQTNQVLNDKLTKSDELIRYLLGRREQIAEVPQSEILTDRISAVETHTAELFAKDIVAGTITADKVKANQIEGLEILVSNIKTREARVAGATTQEDQEVADGTEVPALNIDNFKVGKATVKLDLRVDGTLFANGALKVAGPAEFMGTSVFHRMATFVDTVIFNKPVTFKETATFNNSAAGFATIHKTQKEVEVKFEKAYEQVPVVTITVKNGVFTQYAYEDLTEEGFTIIIPEEASADIKFAWSAVSVEDSKNYDKPLVEAASTAP